MEWGLWNYLECCLLFINNAESKINKNFAKSIIGIILLKAKLYITKVEE